MPRETGKIIEIKSVNGERSCREKETCFYI
jgi:hypothetical protein